MAQKHNQFQKIFGGKKVRSVYDTSGKCRWFSVVDIIAALRGCDHNTARNHWKQIKYRLIRESNKKANVFKYHQLKLPAKDGKRRFTDVMRYRDIVKLVQELSAGVGRAFRKLVGRAAAGSALVRGVFAELGETAGDFGEPFAELQVVTRRKIRI